jgi:hypothetical protein
MVETEVWVGVEVDMVIEDTDHTDHRGFHITHGMDMGLGMDMGMGLDMGLDLDIHIIGDQTIFYFI